MENESEKSLASWNGGSEQKCERKIRMQQENLFSENAQNGQLSSWKYFNEVGEIISKIIYQDIN